jgi:ketosteroid isomerase-like protein
MAAEADENAAIAAQSDRLAECFNDGDRAGLIALYADDAVLLPPGPRTFTGPREIQSFWQQTARIKELRFERREVRVLGAAACEIGDLHLAVGPQSRDVAMKYVLVWHKAAGQWKVETMIWNAAGAPGGQGQGRGPGAGMRGRGGGRGGAGGRGRQPAFVPRIE